MHFKRHTSSETPSGTWYEIKSSGYDLTYYLAKTAATYYKGNGSSVTGRGDSESITPISSTSIRVAAAASVTPIGSTSKRLSSVTRYKAGTNVGRLYNAGEIATYYPATQTLYKSGDSLTYYPADNPLYEAGTNIGKLYNAGAIDSTHYYTKS